MYGDRIRPRRGGMKAVKVVELDHRSINLRRSATPGGVANLGRVLVSVGSSRATRPNRAARSSAYAKPHPEGPLNRRPPAPRASTQPNLS